MTGRPRNPNKPPASHSVRITPRAFQKLEDYRLGKEPLGNIFERVLDALAEYQKKVEARNHDIDGLLYTIKDKNNANAELIKMCKRKDVRISELEEQRRATPDPELEQLR